jgi:hypothetical protein
MPAGEWHSQPVGAHEEVCEQSSAQAHYEGHTLFACDNPQRTLFCWTLNPLSAMRLRDPAECSAAITPTGHQTNKVLPFECGL